MTIVDRLAGVLERHSSRRGFLAQSAIVGSALAVEPLSFLLKPGSAYAQVVCRCGNGDCSCGDPCCDGYTEFCCTITGANTCPPGTVAGGWWRADGSAYCDGPRYYIDCHGECPTQTGPGFCPPSEDGLSCGCALGDCGLRAAGCVTFRYGQCHQEIATVGRIACRVVTCTPAYLLDNACTTTTLFDDNTADQNQPCLQAPNRVIPAYGAAVPATGGGLWLAGPDGGVFAYGTAGFFGSMGGHPLVAPVVAIAAAPDDHGYWLVASDGGVFAFGSARFFGSMGGDRLVAPVVAITATSDGDGYWLAAADGGVFAFGAATFHGSIGGKGLVSPIVAMAPAPDGQGYWLVASDGGVFAFGSARFEGSTGGVDRVALAAGLLATPTGLGYWIWGQDGTVQAFGDAPDLGDYPGLPQAEQTLKSDGISAFSAMGLIADEGYALWALEAIGPPPSPRPFTFGGTIPTPAPPATPSPPPPNPGEPPITLPKL
jgi:hypothetical protein